MKRHLAGLAVVAALLLTLGLPARAATWSVPDDFVTIQAAVNSASVLDGDTIRVGPGSHAGATIHKRVTVKGEDGATIDSGPAHPAGLTQGFRLLAGSDGTTISHLRFTVDLAIMNGAAVNDVTVSHSTFENVIQGVSNWRGSGWEISHNKFFDLRTRCGGGIAVLVADFANGTVNDNVVSHNHILGTLHVNPNDCGGYNGSGIVLYADFRWGRTGTADMSGNRVVKNKVSMASDTPQVVDIAAFELTDTSDPAQGCDIIHDNAIGFNDFRGTALQIDLAPASLESCNPFSRNLGNNRGHGMHPKVFKDDD